MPSANTRLKSVGTKVTDAQFKRYQLAAGSIPMAEWVRSVLDAHLDRAPFEDLALAEIASLRLIVLNTLGELVPGADARIAKFAERQTRDKKRASAEAV